MIDSLNDSRRLSQLMIVQHSQKKRYVAGQYANTNIMRSQVLGGIQDRVDAFVKKCVESGGASIDVYVCISIIILTPSLTIPRSIYTTSLSTARLIISSIPMEQSRSRKKKA